MAGPYKKNGTKLRYYLKSKKFFAFLWIFFSFADDIKKIVSKYKWDSFSVDAKFLLKMTKEMSEINVKDLAIFTDHNIIRMSIAYTKYECSYAVASTTKGECFNCLIEFICATAL